MLIFNQDGKNIINLDNVINIGIQDYEYNLDPRYEGTEIEAVLACAKSIIACFSNNESIILGNYPSQNRAKEVLKEISNFYNNSKMEYAEIIGGKCGGIYSYIFEMPEK